MTRARATTAITCNAITGTTDAAVTTTDRSHSMNARLPALADAVVTDDGT